MKVFKSGILALSLGLLTATVAVAGAGSSGGGQSKNGQLRDLVDRVRIVEIKSGQKVIHDLPTYNQVIAILDAANVSLANELRKEIEKASFYFLDAALNEKIVNGQDGVAKSSEAWEQAGIRVSKEDRTEIYVSLPEFQQMDEYNRSFFVLHEMLHGLIEGDSPVKYLKLRNFVAYVASLYRNDRIPTAAELGQVISEDDVQIPSLTLLFSEAMSKKDSELVRKILPQLDMQKDASDVLFTAVYADDEEVLRYAINAGADINKAGWLGLTPLMQAAKHGSVRCAKILIELGADVNFHPDEKIGANYGGYAPIELALPDWYNRASAKNNLEMVRLLIDSGKLDLKNHRPVKFARKTIPGSRYGEMPEYQEIMKLIHQAYGEELPSWWAQWYR